VPVAELGRPQLLITPPGDVRGTEEQVLPEREARDLQPSVIGLVAGTPRDHHCLGRRLGGAREQRREGPADTLLGTQPEQLGHPWVHPLHPAPLVGDGKRDIAGRQHLAR
jgi:hypothetical protein